MKEIKKVQAKIPTDPYEADLLMMAEMVAGDKKDPISESDTDGENDGGVDDAPSPEPVDNNAFGDDVLQMALKMATEMDGTTNQSLPTTGIYLHLFYSNLSRKISLSGLKILNLLAFCL